MHDFYGNDTEKGSCCWRITGNITDNPDDVVEQEDDGLVGYNIFRNGIQLNNTCIPCESTRYIDRKPIDKAEYIVVAYYNDGRESTPTIPFIANLTNEIKPVINNQF